MNTLSTRAFIAAAVSVLLVIWVGHPASTCATADSSLPEFRALTSIPAIVI